MVEKPIIIKFVSLHIFLFISCVIMDSHVIPIDKTNSYRRNSRVVRNGYQMSVICTVIRPRYQLKAIYILKPNTVILYKRNISSDRSYPLSIIALFDKAIYAFQAFIIGNAMSQTGLGEISRSILA